MTLQELQVFETREGARIHQIPMEAFPGLWTFAYLILYQELCVLIDTGSGYGESNRQLVQGIQAVQNPVTGKPLDLSDLTHVLITHGHIDHIGGLLEVTGRSNALLGVHELDRRNITNYEERRAFVIRKLADYLVEAGVESARREYMLGLYRFMKQLFHSVPIDFTYGEINMQLEDFRFLHVPGHCAGHVVICLHDFHFCGDHILSDITPHQAPEALTPWTGLGHYLQSLDKLESWVNGVRMALCGHQKIITDPITRIQEIKKMHRDRLNLVKEFLMTPKTISALSNHLFGEPDEYDALLAIEETGAHVEYLYQRGEIILDNYEQLESSVEPISLYFKSR